MGLRITTKRGAAVTVLQIDGRLDKHVVGELASACAACELPVCLDLAHLQAVDAEGAAAIRVLESRGATVVGVSPYVEKLLRAKAQ